MKQRFFNVINFEWILDQANCEISLCELQFIANLVNVELGFEVEIFWGEGGWRLRKYLNKGQKKGSRNSRIKFHFLRHPSNCFAKFLYENLSKSSQFFAFFSKFLLFGPNFWQISVEIWIFKLLPHTSCSFAQPRMSLKAFEDPISSISVHLNALIENQSEISFP